MATASLGPLGQDKITKGREQVMARVLQADAQALAPGWIPTVRALDAMRSAYDAVFFESALLRLNCLPIMSLSGRMTRAAGSFTYRSQTRRGEIRVSLDIWQRMKDGPWDIDGVRAHTRLEAVMVVVEHELCHAMELLTHGSCQGHGDVFQAYARGLFGHTSWTHALPTAAQEIAQAGLAPGMWVRFDHAGSTHTGVIARIYKRVAVMVPDPEGGWQDQNGRRMARYLVPHTLLTPVSPP